MISENVKGYLKKARENWQGADVKIQQSLLGKRIYIRNYEKSDLIFLTDVRFDSYIYVREL